MQNNSKAAEKNNRVDLGTDEVIATQESSGGLKDNTTSFGEVISPENAPADSDLGELLQRALGVHVESLGGLGRYSTMSIRGSSGNQVAVYIDGIKLSRGTGAIDLSNLPIAHFSRVEVMRGSYGAQFGDAALGGIVNLVTPRAKQGIWGQSKITGTAFTGRDRGGPADIIQLSSSFGYGGEKGAVFGSIDGLWTNGKFLFEPDSSLGLGNRDIIRRNNGVESLGALLKGSYYLSDNLELYGLADLFAARKEIPGLVSFPTPEATKKERRILIASGTRFLLSELNNLEIDTRVSFLGEESDYNDPSGGSLGFPINRENNDYTFAHNLQFKLPLNTQHLLTFTENLKNESFKNDSGQTHERTTALLSLSDLMSFFKKKLSVVPQAGIELCEHQQELFGLGLGVEFKIFSFLSLKGNCGNGFRRPTFSELYYDQGYYVGNPDLDPETSLGFDIGPAFKYKWFQAEADYFQTRYDDLIVYLLQSGFRYQPYNIGKSLAEGFEVKGKVDLGKQADIEVNWTYSEVLDKTHDPTWRNLQVPGKPRNQVMVRGGLHFGPVHPFAEYHFIGSNPITRANTKLVPERHLFHAGIKYIMSEKLSMELTGKNLTDERAMDIRGFPLPSRGIFASFTLKW